MGDTDRNRSADDDLEGAGSAPVAEQKRSLQSRLSIAVVAVVVLVGLVLLAGAVIPRWWATRISNIVDERITVGTFLGIAVGAIFALVPLLILWVGWRIRKTLRRFLVFLVLAIVVAFPNLATLGVWTGTGSGANSARNKLDQFAPGFQGGTLFGVILGAVTALVIMYLSFSRRRNKQMARDLKAQIKAHGAIESD